jgi:glyoxylase-like metal-dependent hydrolase (beta-lactamase superfamily II)
MHPTVIARHHADTGTWSYVVFDPQTKQAALIDPVLDFDPAAGATSTDSAAELLGLCKQHALDVQWICETHAHADHLSAARWLQQHLPMARIGIGEGIRKVQAHFEPVFHLGDAFRADGSQFDHLFVDGERFKLGEIEARVIATPGHTNDSVSYLIGDALFVGDSLFMPAAGTARCDFPGGSAETLYHSIQRLYELPDSTRVFVCHDYPGKGEEAVCETTIGAQKALNIHVSANSALADYRQMREARDATLGMPRLILPSLQVNLRGGRLPEPEDNGVRYLKLPLDQF